MPRSGGIRVRRVSVELKRGEKSQLDIGGFEDGKIKGLSKGKCPGLGRRKSWVISQSWWKRTQLC